jgi:hypothetical protein
MFDYTGSYSAALGIFALVTLVATGLIGPLLVYWEVR